MPEMIEVEVYRCAAEAVVGRTIAGVDALDAWYLKGGVDGPSLSRALCGRRVEQARRTGKLLLLDFDDGPALGLRFGMTGRLMVDDASPIDTFEYGSTRGLTAWDRFALRFRGGGTLRMNDPRRLGAVELDPDEEALGPDAATITVAQLNAALGHSDVPLKARLMDQRRIAGLGNLLVDEVLYRAGLDPGRSAGALGAVDRRRLGRHVVGTVARLAARGGSHLGDLQVARVRGGRCPRDGAALLRRTIGGRTTYSCPEHQT
ncbi:MAG: DNA-formamidopyrimidine glycosylase family protein [Acidimicrobiales bacterium]